jgi:hypothetical protein
MYNDECRIENDTGALLTKEKGCGEEFLFLLHEYYKQTDNHGEESCSFNERCRQDHVGADITDSFRLTCDGFQRASANAPDTDAGTNSCKTCAYACKSVSDSDVSRCLCNVL